MQLNRDRFLRGTAKRAHEETAPHDKLIENPVGRR